jgi:hypothetical protein
MPGAKITIDENGQIVFSHWHVTHDQPLTSWSQMGLAVVAYLVSISPPPAPPPSPEASS